MKRVKMYVCDRNDMKASGKPCCFMTTDKAAAKAHEAAHLGLTVAEYDRWVELHARASNAGLALACGSNKQKRTAFDAAINALTAMIEAHPALDAESEPFAF